MKKKVILFVTVCLLFLSLFLCACTDPENDEDTAETMSTTETAAGTEETQAQTSPISDGDDSHPAADDKEWGLL